MPESTTGATPRPISAGDTPAANWLSSEACARHLSITTRALEGRVRRGQLPCYIWNRRHWFDPVEIDQCIRQQAKRIAPTTKRAASPPPPPPAPPVGFRVSKRVRPLRLHLQVRGSTYIACGSQARRLYRISTGVRIDDGPDARERAQERLRAIEAELREAARAAAATAERPTTGVSSESPMPNAKRYRRSTEFPVSRSEPRLRVEIDRVPQAIHALVKKAARRRRLSMRTLTLRLWTEWANGVLNETGSPGPGRVA